MQKCTGKSDTLFFSARQGVAEFPDRRIIPIGKGGNKVVNRCFLCRRDDFFFRRIQLADFDIVGNGAFEELAFLRNAGFHRPQRSGRYGFYVLA